MTESSCPCEFREGATYIDCPRHGVRKFRRLWELCVMGREGTSPGASYWRAWEEGCGPGRTLPVLKSLAIAQPRSKATEIPARARARRLACKECPDDNWDETEGFCPLFAGRPCRMRSLFNGPRQVCTHWPE